MKKASFLFPFLLLFLYSCGEEPAVNTQQQDGSSYKNNYTWKHKDFAEKILDSLYQSDLIKYPITEFSRTDKNHYTLKGCPLDLAMKIDEIYEKSYGNAVANIVLHHKNVGIPNAVTYTYSLEEKRKLSRDDSMSIFNKIQGEKSLVKKEKEKTEKKKKH